MGFLKVFGFLKDINYAMTSKVYFEVKKGLSPAAEVHGVPHVDPEPHGVGGDHVGVKVLG